MKRIDEARLESDLRYRFGYVAAIHAAAEGEYEE